MSCKFCEKAESVFVQIVCYDKVSLESVDEILYQGLCVDHAAQPRAEDFAERCPKLLALFIAKYGVGTPSHPKTVGWNVKLHPFDSEAGKAVRIQRLGLKDPTLATVTNPLMAMPTERVTKEGFQEIFGIEQPAEKGTIFSGTGPAPKKS